MKMSLTNKIPRGRIWYAVYVILGLVVLSALMSGDGGQPSGLTEKKIYDTASPNIDKDPIYIDGGDVTVFTDATREAEDWRDLDILYNLIWEDLFTLPEIQNASVFGYVKNDRGKVIDSEMRTMTREEWEDLNVA
jgi:hypothetical protein